MMMNLYRLTSEYRRVLLFAAALVLAGCASSGSERNAPEQGTVIEAQRIAEAAAAARAAEERARIAAAEAERERQATAARQQAEQRAQAEAAAQAQAEREAAARAQAAAEQRMRQAEAAQVARIAELEAEIAAARASIGRVATANSKLEEAIATAEELLEVLNAEQLKYGNTNAAGEPVEPLQKDLIADLEARKDSLKQEAQALSQQ